MAIIILKTFTPPKREVAFTICLYEFGSTFINKITSKKRLIVLKFLE